MPETLLGAAGCHLLNTVKNEELHVSEFSGHRRHHPRKHLVNRGIKLFCTVTYSLPLPLPTEWGLLLGAIAETSNTVLQYSHLPRALTFHDFSYPRPTAVQRYQVKDSRNKQFVRFKLHAVLSIVMTYRTVLLRPAQDGNHPFVQRGHALYATCPHVPCYLSVLSDHLSGYRNARVQVTFISRNNAPKAHGW